MDSEFYWPQKILVHLKIIDHKLLYLIIKIMKECNNK